jgi:uncharacterized membrane protein YphA (DoxX/SURF4 family)
MKKAIITISQFLSRFVLAAIFIYAGYTKVENPLQFAVAVESYQLLPPNGVLWVVRILPWIEIILGLALLSGIKIRYTASFTIGFLLFFIGVMLITYLRGIEADCGCFGIGEKISPFTLLRDALFMLPAFVLLINPNKNLES